MRDKQKKEPVPVDGLRPVGVTGESPDLSSSQFAEAVLSNSEELFRAAFAHAAVGLVIVDLKGRFLEVNQAYCAITGYPRQELLAHDFCSMTHRDDLEENLRLVEQLKAGEIPAFVIEKRYVKKDGSVVWVQNSVSLNRDSAGKPTNFIALCQDITGRKQAEATLREGEREQRRLARQLDWERARLIEAQAVAKVGSWETELPSLKVVWSEETHRIFETDPARFHPTHPGFLGFVHPEDRARVNATFLDSLDQRSPCANEHRIVGPDGRVKIVEERWQTFHDDQGQPVRAVGTCQDITERKRAEQAISTAEQKYRNIFENAGEGIFQTTLEGRYVAANPALACMHGFGSPAELIRTRQDISREVYVDPTQREEFKHLIEAHGFVREFEHQIYRRDGSKIWVSVNARAVRDEQGAILYYEGTTQDIDARKRAEARSAACATLGRKLSGAKFPLEAARIIVDTADQMFGWDSCGFDLYDPEKDLIRTALNVDIIDGVRKDVPPAVAARAPTARGRYVIEQGARLTLRDSPYKFEDDSLRFGDKKRPSASIMSVPIRHSAKVIGILSIQSYEPQFYDHEALTDLQSLADHCGEALNRIHAEESFYESEERFRQMAHHFEDVVWLTDKDMSKVVYVNPAYERIFRRTCESVYERLTSFLDAIHPDDRAGVEQILKREREGVHEPVEYRLVWPDGSVRWILGRSFPIRSTEGEVYLLAGISQDITDRKRTEEALGESEARHRDLVENSRELMCTHDLDGLVLSANPAAAEALGYDLDDFVGKRGIQDTLAPEVRHQFEEYMANLRRDGASSGIMVVQTSSGERRLWEFYNSLRTEGVATPIVRGMARDVTDRKRAEGLLASEKRVLEMIATGASLSDILETLTRETEKMSEGLACSILLLDLDGVHLRHGAAPSLPDAYNRAVDGIAIGPSVGCCGTAAFRKEMVVVEDIATDPLWSVGRKIALEHGLRACWSTPIKTGDGGVLGTFAMYYREPRRPQPRDLELIERATQLATIAIERRRAEAALRRSEREYRGLFENAHDAILIFDPEREIVLQVNQRACRIYGISRAEFVGMSLKTISKNVERGRLLLDETLERGTFHNFETIQSRGDGTEMLLDINASVVQYKGQTAIQNINRDITERKRAEESLRDSEERYRDLVENIQDLVCTHDLDGKVLSANPALENLLGYNLRDFGEKNFLKILAPEARDKFDDYLKRICRDGFASGLMLVQTSTGERRIWEYHNTLRTEGVATPIVRSLARDVTDRRRAEKLLRESENKFRTLAETAPALIFIVQGDKTIYTNAAAELQTGYARQELLRMTFWEVVHPDFQDLARERSRARQSGEAVPSRYEVKICTKDNQERWLDVCGSTIEIDGKPAGLGVAIDITERKQAEEALVASERRYRDIFTFAPVGIYQSRRDGTFITVNKTLAEMLGYDSVAELLKLKFDDDVYFVAGERQRLIGMYEDRGYGGDIEIQWKRKDGSPIWIQLTAHAIKGANGATEYFEGYVHDISERKRQEEALHESEAMLKQAQRVAVLGHYDFDVATDSWTSSEVLDEIFGIDVAYARNLEGWTDIVHPEQRDEMFAYLRDDVLRERNSFDREYRIVRINDRAVRWVHGLGKLEFNTEGHPARMFGVIQDITERKRAEEDVFNLRRELELTMDSMEEGVHRVDLQGNIVFENPAAARMLGWESADLLDKPAHATMHHTRPDGTPYPKEECPIYATFCDGVSRQVTEEVFWRQDGTSFPVEYTAAPVRNDSNEIVAGVVTFRDITERKDAEKALRESEERYRSLFENAKDAIYVHDLSGRYVSVNRAAEKLSGFTREEIIGKHYSNFVAPSHLKYVRKNLCKKLDEENETIYEVFIITKDRQVVPVEVSSRLIYENGVFVGVQGTARDITERKRAQETLQNYSRGLIAAQEAERQHIARELHDEIGQVLTAVKINLQSIQRLSSEPAWMPPLDESIGIVDEALGRVRELSIELRPSLLDDLGLVAALRWYVDRYAQRTGIRAEVVNGFEEDSRLPRELETACFRIAQEALTNVARHAQAASVSVHLERSREKVLLTIADDGVGFDVETVFRRATAVAALGLRGMEERTLALSGKIEIESAVPKGTWIRVTFPLKRK